MAQIKVSEAHGTEPENAIQLIASFEEMMGKYGVKVKWKGHQGDIKGMGVSGHITVDSANVTVTLKLGMMARAAGVDAKRLEASIRKRLVAAFKGD
ncbi:MAG: polyhydroxyalkanoic acid system family protein [Myxococcota bacterium]|nr:polyhydroxyalkanoic acid system family protein [Myxococcota bacterium]